MCEDVRKVATGRRAPGSGVAVREVAAEAGSVGLDDEERGVSPSAVTRALGVDGTAVWVDVVERLEVEDEGDTGRDGVGVGCDDDDDEGSNVDADNRGDKRVIEEM